MYRHSAGPSAIVRVGEFRVTHIQAGYYYQDGGCMFGVVPKSRWARAIPPNDANLIRLAFNCYVVETGTDTVLIETGGGAKTDLCAERDGGTIAPDGLPEILAAAGIDPRQINIVINSHLHWDHCGGNTVHRGRGLEPAFPQAQYYCSKEEFEHARELHVRDAISYLPEKFVPLHRTGRLRLVEGVFEPVPGIRMCPAPGHNQGMNIVLAQSGPDTFCFLSDLVPTAAHLMPTWVAAFDLFPLQSIVSKTEWISRAANERWICGFGHDSRVAFATVTNRFEIADNLTVAPEPSQSGLL
jgi:glyoxylase-like metal-dependent hydrolase (beta-lactamase superfamily II)